MRYVFTGPTRLNVEQGAFCYRVLTKLDPADEYVTGGAFGLDVLAAEFMLNHYPRARHTIIVPDAWYDKITVKRLAAAGAMMRRAPNGPHAYRARNKMMFTPVVEDQILHAFLFSGNFYRSGEWMTVNIAKKMDPPVPVRMHILPGKERK